jgi:hypothetical protein
MAKDIAALSGGDKTAFKAALAGMGYAVPVWSHTISTPEPYFDIDLPSDAVPPFIIIANNVSFSANDQLGLVFSTDGGVTFYCDADHFDTYGCLRKLSYIQSDGTVVDGALSGQKNDDSVAAITGMNAGPTRRCFATIYIDPGSADHLLTGLAKNFATGTDGELFRKAEHGFFLNPDATIPPALGRANLVRVLPVGNEDNPPTSSHTITTGTFHLFRIPAV